MGLRRFGRCRRTAAAAAMLALSSCASGPKVPQPSPDIDETAYRTHLQALASDELEGRRPGTAGEQKTVAYLTEQFRRLGLKPVLGESFVQAVPMVEVASAADGPLIISGKARKLELASPGQAVVWTRRREPQAVLQGSELVFVGYGIVAPEYDWNDYAGIDVDGKTVVVLPDDPGYGARDPKLFKGGAMTYYGRWSYKVEEAARQGAAGVLIVHDPDALGFVWAAVESTFGRGQLDLAAQPGEGEAPRIEGWIRKDAARAMFSASGLDLDGAVEASAHAGFKAQPLSARLDVRLRVTVRPFTSSNVIAMVPGGRRECVLYVAHWDGLGRDAGTSGHDILNGATENASGVAGLLTLAQSFARTRPAAERAAVFVATTGGEPRSLGSEYYASNPAIPLHDTAAVLNLDALHRGGPTRDFTLLNPGNTDLEEYARGAALLEGREVTPEAHPEWGEYYNSDSLIFARAGVPVLYAKAGLDDSARGPAFGREQLEDYLLHRRRQSGDRYAPDWDVRGAVEDLRVYYEVGNRVARGRRFPRWYPNSEFRVSRTHRAEAPDGGPRRGGEPRAEPKP